jgi:hypothetical protein
MSKEANSQLAIRQEIYSWFEECIIPRVENKTYVYVELQVS